MNVFKNPYILSILITGLLLTAHFSAVQSESGVYGSFNITSINPTPASSAQYSIAGVPTILFLDSDGNEVKVARVVGFLNSGSFLKKLEKAENSHQVLNEYSYMSQKQFRPSVLQTNYNKTTIGY